MQGLGDNLYQRPVIRSLCESHRVYLETPWPQFYADLGVSCLTPKTGLRTQAKNIERGWEWTSALRGRENRQRLHYLNHGGCMPTALFRDLGLAPPERIDMAGPPVPDVDRAPYALVRPVTVRKEWPNAARNPDPQYIDRAARAARDAGLEVVSIADIDAQQEWPVDGLPYADTVYHGGELLAEELLAMVKGAACVIGGIGWMVPAALAYRTPMFAVYGGQGFHNSPARILGEAVDASMIYSAVPDDFCLCKHKRHECSKVISGIDDHIERFFGGLCF